nr:hypothetical protein [Enterococcus faecium]
MFELKRNANRSTLCFSCAIVNAGDHKIDLLSSVYKIKFKSY